MDVDTLALELETLAPERAIEAVLAANQSTRVCITSSFQAEDMIVTQFLRERVSDVPVLFLDTGYHFPQTYEYRDRMTREWSLNLVNVLPTQTVAEQESAFGILYRSEPTRCCQLRKVEPLMRALESFDVWFTGLRREQSPTRQNLKKVELHRLPTGKNLWKVSLLADWNWQKVGQYANTNGIPRSEEHTSELQSHSDLVCRLLLEKKKNKNTDRLVDNNQETEATQRFGVNRHNKDIVTH